MKLVFVSILLTWSLGSFAQINEMNPFFNQDSPQVNVDPIRLTSLGEYYFSNLWNAGNIHFNNGKILRGYYMKHNLVSGMLEVIIEKEIVGFHHNQIMVFEWFNANTIKSSKFMHRSQLTKSNDFPHFLEVIEEGDVKLLFSKKILTLQKGSAPSLVNDTSGDTEIIEQFYFHRAMELTEVRNGRKKNLDYFDSKMLEDFVKENSLGWNKLNDLKKIVSYYNQID